MSQLAVHPFRVSVPPVLGLLLAVVSGCGAPVAPVDSDPYYERGAAWLTVESTGERLLGEGGMRMQEGLGDTCRATTMFGWGNYPSTPYLQVSGWFPTDDELVLPPGGTTDIQVQQQAHRTFKFPWPDGTIGFPGDGRVWLHHVGDAVRIGVETTTRCDVENPDVPEPYACTPDPLHETYWVEWHDPTERVYGNSCILRSDMADELGLCLLSEPSTPADCVAPLPGASTP